VVLLAHISAPHAQFVWIERYFLGLLEITYIVEIGNGKVDLHGNIGSMMKLSIRE